MKQTPPVFWKIDPKNSYIDAEGNKKCVVTVTVLGKSKDIVISNDLKELDGIIDDCMDACTLRHT